MRIFYIAIFCLLTLASLINFSCQAVEKVYSSIAKTNGDKIYLNSGTIQIQNNEMFLCVDNDFIPLSHLEKDDEGIYFKLDEISTIWGAAICPYCNYPIVAPFCVNPNCPGNR